MIWWGIRTYQDIIGHCSRKLAIWKTGEIQRKIKTAENLQGKGEIDSGHIADNSGQVFSGQWVTQRSTTTFSKGQKGHWRGTIGAQFQQKGNTRGSSPPLYLGRSTCASMMPITYGHIHNRVLIFWTCPYSIHIWCLHVDTGPAGPGLTFFPGDWELRLRGVWNGADDKIQKRIFRWCWMSNVGRSNAESMRFEKTAGLRRHETMRSHQASSLLESLPTVVASTSW